MTNPLPNAVHIDSALTNLSVAFFQKSEHFIAGRVFPNVPVDKQSDRYYTYDRGDFNRDEARERAPGTESAGSGFNIDNTPTYYAKVFAFHKDIPWQLMANADAIANLERAASEYVAHKMLIRKEKDFMTRFFQGGIWTNDWDGVSGAPTGNQVRQWSDYVNSDPITDIRNAKSTILESTGFMPNTLVLGQRVMDSLADHPDIVDRVKYSGGVGNGNPAMINAQTLAALFEVERILVGRAIENTGFEGNANAHSFIAGKRALLCYSAPAPSILAPSAGYTFSWNGYLSQTNEHGIATARIPVPLLKSDRIEGEIAMDHKLISADLGYFWDTIVA